MEARASSPAQNSHVYSICVNRKYDYRRKLPHLQPDRKLFFVTFQLISGGFSRLLRGTLFWRAASMRTTNVFFSMPSL
jgi:hypothetical protein